MCRYCGDIRCRGCGPAVTMRQEYYYWKSVDRDDKADEIRKSYESAYKCGINGGSLFRLKLYGLDSEDD